MGGAVNNVATGKINCVQAAGLGGAFRGAKQARRGPSLWSFKQARKWGKQGRNSMVAQSSMEKDHIEPDHNSLTVLDVLC